MKTSITSHIVNISSLFSFIMYLKPMGESLLLCRKTFVMHLLIILCLLPVSTSGLLSDSLFDEVENVTPAEEMITTPGDVHFQLSLGIDMLIPRSDFKRHNDNLGFGFGFNLGFFIPETPIILGFDMSFISFGSEDWSEDMVYDMYDEVLNVESSYNILASGLFLRIQPYEGFFQPYLELFGGFNYSYADSRIEIIDDWWDTDEDDDETITDFEDMVGCFGFGGGVLIALVTGQDHNSGLFMDFNVKYLYGGEAKYLKKGSKFVIDNDLHYKITKSRTDSYSMRLGVALRL